MKKSFKKAGAAVLSMAMLLSMGAVSMPVYADLATHETVVPTQVAVTIANNNKDGDKNNGGTGIKHADDVLHTYDYLEDVTSAKVTMYRVATLEGNGWQWDSGITTIAATDPTFAQLLEKVIVTDSTTTPPTTGTPTDSTPEDQMYPKLDSDTLQALAGKLQQAATSSGSTVPKVAEEYIHKLNDGFETIYLPQDDDLFKDAPQSTKNVIGYYLIVTDPDDTGYVMQPVLVPIKNGVTEAGGRSVKNVSIKGVKVNVDKSIEDVYTKVDKDDKVIDGERDAATGDKTYVSRENISTDKNSAIVDADDVISYQIMADVPRYSKDVSPNGYSITDTPEQGINVIGSLTSSDVYIEGVSATTSTVRNGEIVLYYSSDDELITTGANADTKLEEYTDYSLEPVTGTGIGKGFKVNFSAPQLRGTASGSSMSGKTMEGGHIFVLFKAKTDENFQRENTGSATVTPDPTLADVTWDEVSDKRNAVTNDLGDATKTLALSKVSKSDLDSIKVADGGKTRTLVETEYEVPDTDPADTDYDLIRFAAYLVLSEKQAAVDLENANAAKTKKEANGTTNTAKVTFNNSYTHDGQPEDVEDITNLYSVKLDLTKVAFESKTLAETTKSPYFVTAFEVSTPAATAPTGAVTVTVEGETKNLMLKNGSTWETTTDPDEAKDPTNENRIKYVTTLTTATTGTPATITGASGTVYVKDDGYTTTTTVGEAKADTEATGNYVDSFEHSKKVQGAVFKLEEDFDQVNVNATDVRAGGDDGYHARELAITDDQGELYIIKAGTPQANEPTIETTISSAIANNEAKFVYYTVEGTGANATYTPYYLTSTKAWDRVGEGKYRLTEVSAPAGYKKWSAPATFTITAVKDSNGNFTGEFVGKSADGAFLYVDPTDNTKVQKADGTHEAHFVHTATGELQNEIVNDADDTLPATGGIGTVLFTAGGISIVLIAGALFVMYMKKRNAEDEE